MTPEYRDFLEIQTLKEEIQKLDIDARSADALRLIEIKEERLIELCRRATTLQPRFVKEGRGYFNENDEWVVIEKGEALHPIEVPAGPILLKGKRWEHLLAKLLEQEDMPPETEAPESSPSVQYVLMSLGKRWKYVWDGKEYDSGQYIGWQYIRYCMKNPKRRFKNVDLYGAIHPNLPQVNRQVKMDTKA